MKRHESNSEYKYKFSVVIPIYNVEDYLAETIDSVIGQTIGFEENIELILVNDGSPDNSEKICLEYKKKYPNNIKYILKKNGGVSSARNEGMKHVEGKYINFLDSDDKWEKNAFKKVYSFMEKHPEIDVTATKLKFFGARTGLNHPLNWKFKETGIVDINKEYSKIQMSVNTTFIRKEALTEQFSTELKYAEDSQFINKIILKKQKYGVISDTHYLYRKREDGTSALDNSLKSKNYYLNTLEYFHKEWIDYCKKNYGELPKYIQFVMMYDLQWKIKSRLLEGLLTNEEVKQMKKDLRYVLSFIDDEIIMEQKQISKEYKEESYLLKYNNKIKKSLKVDGVRVYYNKNILYSFKKRLTLNIINVEDNKIEIRGFLNVPLTKEDVKLYYEIDGKKKEVKFDEHVFHQYYSIDKVIPKNKYFKINDKISAGTKISFFIEINGERTNDLRLNFGQLSKLSNKYRIYYKANDKLIRYRKKKIIVEKNTKSYEIKRELILFLQLLKHFKIKPIIIRSIYHLLNSFKKKEIWLISDRPTAAGDNGYHFFKYVVEKNDKDIKPYFIIDKSSNDYHKMKKIGNVLNYNSFKYKINFLLSDKIISSQADLWVQNAFGKDNEFYRDLYTFDQIFLQHGIIMNDFATWLKCYDKNFKIFVTSAQGEYDSIVNGNYGYDKNVVKLTGLPRYDNLQDDSKKIIAIMPTWRNYISERFAVSEGKRLYNEKFKESEYFEHYNRLINDEELLNVMRDNGYEGLFVVHPCHVENSIDFEENEVFKVNSGIADYQKIFKEANLLITDYSSVHFDFAYLKKPVIYTLFDKEDFFTRHTSQKGYFEYERDSFGPVCYDYESTKKAIIETINNDCKLEKKYEKKIDKFYKYKDKKNCERVYKEIKNLKIKK